MTILSMHSNLWSSQSCNCQDQSHNVDKNFDASIDDQDRFRDLPVWNPWEYFVMTLSHCMRQVMWEWSTVMLMFKKCFEHHVSWFTVGFQYILSVHQNVSIFNADVLADIFVDDDKFTCTKKYTRIVQLLCLLHNSLVKLIESWDSFQSGEI